MKATERCFPVVLFIMLYRVVTAYKPEHEILTCNPWQSVLSYAVEDGSTFESLDKIRKCDHSNEKH